jgi:hypothetical protein
VVHPARVVGTLHGMDVVVTGAGAALAALVFLDVLRTVLHPDLDGVISRLVQRAWWRVTRQLTRPLGPPAARRLGVVAASLAMASVVAAWVGGFIVGASVAIKPHLERSFAAQEPAELGTGFVDAVYVVGNLVTVLGFGDVVPVTSTFQVVAVVLAAAGFSLLTAIVAFLLQSHDAARIRNELAMLLVDEIGDGEPWHLAWDLAAGEAARTIAVLDRLADGSRAATDAVRRLPLVGVLHRGQSGDRDFPTVLSSLTELAAASLLVAEDCGGADARRSARSFAASADRLVGEVASRHLVSLPPSATEADVRRCRDLAATLGVDRSELGHDHAAVLLVAAHRNVVTELVD